MMPLMEANLFLTTALMMLDKGVLFLPNFSQLLLLSYIIDCEPLRTELNPFCISTPWVLCFGDTGSLSFNWSVSLQSASNTSANFLCFF